MSERIPYGAWPSPISAADVAAGGLRLANAQPVGEQTWWAEGRPAEGGRVALVRADTAGATSEVLPAGWNVRTRVHEYGGLAWLPLPAAGDGAVAFVNWADQRLYRLDAGSQTPAPLTPQPAEPAALRYADLVLGPGGDAVWCVRESHADGAVTRALVAVPLDGSAATDAGAVRELVGGSDFLAFPRPSPDGAWLAWIAWDHPRMPWDGTELRLAPLAADGTVGTPRTLLGGPDESVLQPEWGGPQTLYAVSDRSGWWNLYAVPPAGGEPVALCPRQEEFADPLWVLGARTYGVLPDGRLLVRHGTHSNALAVLDPAGGELTDLDLPYGFWSATMGFDGSVLAAVAAGPTTPPSLVRVDVATGAARVLRRALTDLPDAGYLPTPRAVTVSGPGERDVHASVYPPANVAATAPDGELPPYVVFVHGGPTSQSPPVFSLEAAYFTSRGIGVVDVDYGGSSGYGRAYRERLRRQWGVVDVEDCVAAVRALVAAGDADGERLAIRGGSAGGWTALSALTTTDAFAAGTSYYGVAELLQFVQDTHDFESRYIDGLVGTLPQDRDVYVERAPLSHVDRLACPVLLLQGLEDQVVPPSQAEMFVAALAAKGIPHAYLAFPGEQHGFRRAETVVAALEAELSFYGQVFGFTPPGIPVLALSTGETAGVSHDVPAGPDPIRSGRTPTAAGS